MRDCIITENKIITFQMVWDMLFAIVCLVFFCIPGCAPSENLPILNMKGHLSYA